MKVSVKKTTLKIIITIIIIIVVIVVGIVAGKNIMINTDIKKMEEKLGQIDAKEFQEKIIKELEKSSLNISDAKVSGESMPVETYFSDTFDNSDGFVMAVSLWWWDTEESNGIAFPCFKIKSDSAGKFQTIEYISGLTWFENNVIEDIIKKVFKEEYNIDMHLIGKNYDRYCAKFSGPEHKPAIIGQHLNIEYDDGMFSNALLQLTLESVITSYEGKCTNDFYYEYINNILEKEATTVIWGRLDS